MTCTEEYREHIEYTFHAFCKVVIRNATINAARTRSRKHKREISLEYLTDEKHYPLGTTDEYFQAPESDEEYILTLCGDTVIFSSGLLAEALSRLNKREREILNVFLVTKDDIIICDPEAEYFPLVHRLGGQVIKISPTSSQYVNPMDMSLNYSEDDNPLALKSDFILSFCELAAGGRNGLEPVEKTVIDRAVRIVYRPYLADPKPENVPILGDLYDEIKRQPEPEAARIAAALELYVHGSLNVFNHRTNVDITNRLVCFDIKELGKQLKNLGMLVIQDQVWNRVTVNRSEGKSTRYYVDEFHLLLRGEVGSWSVEIWKRFRKWGGIPTGITQNIKDLLASPEIENIFENSDFIYLLNQASGDRKILCERLNISTQQAAHISNSGPGQGLIFFGNVILPFMDDFPQDNELYSIMTTKPGEVVHKMPG